MNFMRLIQSESYRKGTALSVLFNIISKGILFLLTIIIARYFGSNIKTDIYFFVFATMILFSGFINSIDTAVLIPESMRIREKEGNESAERFLNFFLLIYLFIGIAFLFFMYFSGPAIFGLISKFSDADIALYHDYFWVGSFFFVFHVLTNYLNTILTSYKYFSIPMLISSIKSCIAIVCIFLFKSRYGVLGVFFAGITAYAFNLLVLLIIMKKMLGWKFSIKIASVKKITWSNIFYAELGQIATVASSMFPLYLLSGFGSGILSVMNYGKNIADIPNTLVTTQFSNVSGIKLNEEAAIANHAAMNDTFIDTTKLLVFILVPLGFFLFVFATPVVQLFYASKNFNAEAVEESAMFLKLLALSIFCIGANSMVTRIFIALQAIRQAFFYQVVLNVLLIAAIWICTQQYGAYGYPIGIIIVNVINLFGMYIVIKKIAPFINYTAVIKYTVIIVLINAAIACGLYFAAAYTNLPSLVTLVSGFLLYLIILLALNKQFKLNTRLTQLIRHVLQRFF